MKLIATLLILVCLLAVAIPQRRTFTPQQAQKACLANEQTLINAIQAARIEKRLKGYSLFIGPVRLSSLPDLQTMPICPSGGKYSVMYHSKTDHSTVKVHCSIHGDFDPVTYKQ